MSRIEKLKKLKTYSKLVQEELFTWFDRNIYIFRKNSNLVRAYNFKHPILNIYTRVFMKSNNRKSIIFNKFFNFFVFTFNIMTMNGPFS